MTAADAPLQPQELDLRHPLEPLSPPAGGTVVLRTADARTQGEAAARLAPGLLDAEESRRAAAFVRDADRAAYITAHVALRLLLGPLLDTAPAAVRFARQPCPVCGGPNGRPVSVPAGTHFSLSHSRHLILLAFAAVPVGADVEALPSARSLSDLRAFLHPREQAELAALPESGHPAAFARAWVRKEAYLKGTGTGLAHESDGYAGTGPVPAQERPGWLLRDVVAPEGFTGAIALRSAGETAPGR
ncbi:4'-phosphopantetheinyl transferase superfamily protein [Streptomyces sp. LP05-1]|uniref:4'-phosphopantetheinyl transferase superfamily protein n=1 Tax=Streptomyces pyxinae TaxID=2970734 RepID=A0ABT2CJ77_9ACTN|nr:4'-phosphopantetheinyl transferase superfamily protein [Streptomyces sp. LP05-1]MCS0637468.1 4'-phosphopantetheinyl transferase superfamily protein [Streptomyces sp. LP05-1]